ncbi:fructosamine kinase family protein [Prochlorococcus marinus XMU1414]|uniref:Fructosamine kinase family protein n=1 Tax=Prochlorococcus marinus XMU1424 TaxID=2774497 RepID=A0A9D9G542_PROMR|nr:fructosamine kinase family protein [Prochlorococcus marinus]MBO8229013.1 fructosamine kinase family protein [Prochlorococcus marinus XMU1414]MBW3046471.1 kinase [Prochlorococcus marinus str. MU1414]MCR8533091.1 fructosamine kinase family protein [Prochlorococcus marinus XMU1420]MCR8536009.1 fructosamine kinase family protein [Prochlorococcus marinus XMU1424]
MQKLSPIEINEICEELGETYPKSIEQVHGGDIHSAWQIEFSNKKLFLKRNIRNKKFLEYEKYCLQNLRKYINHENLVIPEVIAYKNIKNIEILLIEWIDMHNFDQKKLGKGLGELHLKSAESNPKMFGFPVEGFIGTTDQKKGMEDNWIDCFLKLRIIPQLLILKSTTLDKEIINKVKEKIKSELLNHKPINALVHGDLWSGNAGMDKSGKGVIFDPASWWADNEVDIAMTKLFGGFRKEFYEEYHRVFPIKSGFEKRIIIYNFYHILNHANMFGGGYLKQVKDYVKAILNM